MNPMTKRMIALGASLALSLNLVACSSGTTESTPTSDVSSASVFKMLYASEVTTLNYMHTTGYDDLMMAANSIDCLVEYDSYGVVQPSLALSWYSNDDATEWTFKLREGVMWRDHEGNEIAEVTAHDWVSTARWINDAANNASWQYMYSGIVNNADAYYDYTAALINGEEVDEVDFNDVGVHAIDDYTLVYTMESPCPFFISVLSYSCYMPVYGPWLDEQGSNFGLDHTTLLYNAGYLISDFQAQNQRALTKNPYYWDADSILIDEIQFMYNATASTLAPEQFIRGEVDYAPLDVSLLNSWLSDVGGKRDMVSATMPNPSYSYFYAFNFEPRFDDVYEPENWNIAVNNENFRKSIMFGLDRVNALSVLDPQNPESLLSNTVTPANFATAGGLDYTQYPALENYASDFFNSDDALEAKAVAMAELTEAGATFPIKILMRYNPSTTNWDKECQVVEQQLENLLGTDYIDIIVEAGPSTNYLAAVRRVGDYALMKCNWGADYADPQTWTDPLGPDNTYNFMNQDATRTMSEEPCDSKTAETAAIVNEYYDMVDEAKLIYTDEVARYTTFAEAEAFLLDHALVIPIHTAAGSYVATRLNSFEAQYAPYGMARMRYKGMTLRDEALSMDEYTQYKAEWDAAREVALAAAN